MTKLDVYNTKGEKVEQITLPKKIFAAKVNEPLMAQAVRVYLSNQRMNLAKSKRRGEMISKTTAKVWRQKGTGRARHGSKRAPIFVGGGKAHGPTGKQNYKLKISKKMKKAALFSALTIKRQEKAIWIIDSLDKLEGKTKKGVKMLEAVLKKKSNDKVLVGLVYKKIQNVKLALKNLKNVKVLFINNLNTYEVLKTQQLVLVKESIDVLKTGILKEKNKKEQKN